MIETDGTLGFFVWAYYPQERLTPETVKRFQYDLELRNFFTQLEYLEDETSGWAGDRKKLLDGSFYYYEPRFILADPGDLDPERWSGPFDINNPEHRKASLKVDHESYFQACAGMPGKPEIYPKYQRSDCYSIGYFTRKDNNDPKDPNQRKPFLFVLREFATLFDVVYGFGHYHYNRWVKTHDTMPPPERRIWPFNIFNLDRYDNVILTRLRAYANSNPEWHMEIVEGHIVFFYLEDLTTPEKAISPQTTELILGSGDQVLLPKGQTGI